MLCYALKNSVYCHANRAIRTYERIKHKHWSYAEMYSSMNQTINENSVEYMKKMQLVQADIVHHEHTS